MRTSDAVNPAPGLYWGLVVMLVVYTVLTAVTLFVLRYIARTECRGGRMLANVVLGFLWGGITAYVLLAGADFGAGFWDLLAGSATDGYAETPPHRGIDRSCVGGQSRLAHLRPGGHVDGVPHRLRRDRLDSVHPAHGRGVRSDPPRFHVRVPWCCQRGLAAAPLRRCVRDVVGADAVLPRNGCGSDRVGARPAGDRAGQRHHQLAQPELDPWRRRLRWKCPRTWLRST